MGIKEMKKQLAFALTLLMGLTVQNTYAANECRLKYKYGNSGNKYQYINKGKTVNLVRSNFYMAQNVGRNDIRLTLEYVNLSGQTKTEYMTLIKSGSVTLSIPPIPLIGKKLKRVQCKNYAAIIDAQSYLQQFGGTVSNIINQVTNTANSAVINAANSAKNIFSASSANTYKNNAQAAIAAVNSAFDGAKSSASNRGQKIRTNLSQHFPEVNQAVNASTQYGWKLGTAVLTQGEQNIRKTLSEVSRLDRKYGVSSTAATLVSINLAKDFPELNQLKSFQCKLNSNSAIQFTGSIGGIASELARLDTKYQFSNNSKKIMKTLISIPSSDKSKLMKSMNSKNCQRAWQDLGRKIASDSKLLEKYLRTVKAELLKLKAAQFRGSQGAFFREVQKLITATDALIRENQAQNRRRDNMDKADKAHQKAFNQIRNDLGPIQDDLVKLPLGDLVVEAGLMTKEGLKMAYVPLWLFEDSKRLKVLLTREINAAKSYKRSIEIYEEGKIKLKNKFNAFLKQTGVTISSAVKVRVKLPKGSRLISILKSPPNLKFLLSTKNTVVTCVTQFLQIKIEAIDVIVKAIDQYLKNISTVISEVLPNDVKQALSQLNKALVSLKKKKLNTADIKIFNKAKSNLNSLLRNLWTQFKQDPKNSSFSTKIKNLFKAISTSVNRFRADANKTSSSIQVYGRSVEPVMTAIVKLNNVLAKHKNTAFRDVKTFVRKALGFQVKWNSVKKLATDIKQCADKYFDLISKANSSFISRLQKLIGGKVQAIAKALPKNLKTKLSAVKVDLSGMLSKFNQLKSSINQAATAFEEMSTSRNSAIGSLVPFPKPDAPQKVQLALAKVNVLRQKLQAVDGKWKVFNTAQQKLNTDLAYLLREMTSIGGGVASDAVKLASQPFDGRLISSQVGGINVVFNKWNSALQTLPSRMAALVTGGLSAQVESQVTQGLAYMNSKNSQLMSCLNTAITKRNSIGSSQQRNNAVNKVIAGLSAEVTAVKSSLNALMPPTLNILNKISSTMNKAQALANKIASIGSSASSQFASDIAGLRSQLSSAKSCVISKHNLVNTKKTQLLNLINQ